jgi:hypothetical protein
VESGTATVELDLNRLNGITSLAPKFEALHFDVTANSEPASWCSTIFARPEDRWLLSRVSWANDPATAYPRC